MSDDEAPASGSIELSVGADLGFVHGELKASIARSWRRRSNELVTDAADFAQMSERDLLDQVRGSEQLQDMLYLATSSAIHSSLRNKRLGLARSVGGGVLAADEARLDGWGLLLATLDKLEPAHLRVLQVMTTRLDALDDDDALLDAAISVTDLRVRVPSDPWLLWSIVQTLEGIGLAEPAEFVADTGQGPRIGQNRLYLATKFGSELIRLCYSEELHS